MNEEHSAYHFTQEEIWHLVASTIVLAAAFGFVLSCSFLFDTPLQPDCGDPGIKWDSFLWPALPISLVLVLAAFVFHELAHKLVAQHYGMWAEFRASMPGLGLGLIVSAILGIVVALPGAVMIYPNPKPRPAFYETEAAYEAAVATYEEDLTRHSGIISVAGPVVNLVFALISLPLWLATAQGTTFEIQLSNFGNFFQLALLINVVLAAFNMLPIKPLDGSKIIRWSWLAFVGVWVVILALFWLMVS